MRRWSTPRCAPFPSLPPRCSSTDRHPVIRQPPAPSSTERPPGSRSPARTRSRRGRARSSGCRAQLAVLEHGGGCSCRCADESDAVVLAVAGGASWRRRDVCVHIADIGARSRSDRTRALREAATRRERLRDGTGARPLLDHIVGMKLDDEAASRALPRRLSVRPSRAICARGCDGRRARREGDRLSQRSHSVRTGRAAWRAGAALLDAVDNPAALANAVEAVDFVQRHRDSERLAHRLEALEMAIRLVRYLAVPTRGDAASLADSASFYAGNDAFVDLARRLVWRGETEASLVRLSNARRATLRCT